MDVSVETHFNLIFFYKENYTKENESSAASWKDLTSSGI